MNSSADFYDFCISKLQHNALGICDFREYRRKDIGTCLKDANIVTLRRVQQTLVTF